MDTLVVIQTIFIAATAIATIIYAVLTIILVKETRKLREVQAEPEIVCYLQESRYVMMALDLIVKNIGGSTAFNINWDYDKDAPLLTRARTDFNKLRFFKGIDQFSPGQEYRTFFAMGYDLLKEPEISPMELNLDYQNRGNKKFTRKFYLDPMRDEGRTFIGGEPLNKIADNLEKVARNLDHFSTGFKKLKVDVFNSIDREGQNHESEDRD
jgi:hypothetical protein